MVLRKTYKLKRGPLAINIDKYARDQNKKFRSLLKEVPEENRIQRFLEENPSFVPGAWTSGSKSGHYPLHCALVSQPILRGPPMFVPDFMWISTHSLGWYPTLVEIENPKKKIFTKAGIPRAQFTQAKNQLEKWNAWFNKPSNVSQFMDDYRIPDYMRDQRQMQLHMILIYGRRTEFDSKPQLSKERMSLFGQSNMELMSFDRLSCDKELRNAITVKLKAKKGYEALCVPPTFRLGPALADRYLEIDGLDGALDRAVSISADRRKFLKNRLPYWMEWANQKDTGMYVPSDLE